MERGLGARKMLDYSIGFIGGGRITKIFLGGYKNADISFRKVVVSEPDEKRISVLKGEFPDFIIEPNGNKAVAKCDIVFLAVHPPVMGAVLDEIKPVLSPETMIISLVPKFTIAGINEKIGGSARIARSIPNAGSLVNYGYNPIAFGKMLSIEERNKVISILAPLGECPEVPEEELEAYAVITAMGPTYLWFQLYELQTIAEKIGIKRETAKTAVLSMAAGALKLMEDNRLDSTLVMDLIPVKPLDKEEEYIKSILRSKLEMVYNKLKS
ncbi:MAG: NAD(P)-binding domain-containing protein [candidate division Zixibacteria bacterium]|nr:NAD(P)-binding domain-containing protein [candidate division Zixibacteria bacterium]